MMSRLIVLHVVECLNHSMHKLHLHDEELLQRLIVVALVVVVVVATGASVAAGVHHLIE